MRRVAVLVLACVVPCCGGGQSSATSQVGGITLTSDAFTDGGSIPARYTCDGAGIAPRLHWSGVPARAAELVLTMRDPDAPGGAFIHWLLYGIDPTSSGLVEGAVPAGARQGRSSAGNDGYTPPCPPAGSRHHYVFTLNALSSSSGLAAGAASGDVDAAVTSKVIASGVLTGLYGR